MGQLRLNSRSAAGRDCERSELLARVPGSCPQNSRTIHPSHPCTSPPPPCTPPPPPPALPPSSLTTPSAVRRRTVKRCGRARTRPCQRMQRGLPPTPSPTGACPPPVPQPRRCRPSAAAGNHLQTASRRGAASNTSVQWPNPHLHRPDSASGVT